MEKTKQCSECGLELTNMYNTHDNHKDKIYCGACVDANFSAKDWKEHGHHFTIETWSSGDFMDMVYIPSGEFMMGSPDSDKEAYEDEKPQHLVKVKEFLMKSTPVTREEWTLVMGNDPSHFKKYKDAPVEMVSWYDSIAFCNKISVLEGYTPVYILHGETGVPGTGTYRFESIEVNEEANGYYLPSEEEWEYAARAGSTESRYGKIDEIAWYTKNSGGHTHPVAQKKPNAWGLYDVLGNVWEWTFSQYVSYKDKLK